jgi:DNA invertase Pin-like site-specific DNA recombinase
MSLPQTVSATPEDFGYQPVVIYTRVSTDNQVGGRFDSCESQAAYCREEITRNAGKGWTEIACLTDAAYSGGTMERPGMRTLKRMIEAGEVKIVLIYKLERVMRSTDEWIPFRAFLKKHGCRLVSATEDISEDTPSGRLKNMLLMSVNTYERENTAAKTKAKMLQQAKQGFWNGGLVPFGYTYDRNTQKLQPDPVEAPILRRIFEKASQLVSLTDLANELNAEGIRTKARVWRRRDGSEVTVGGRMFRSDGLRLMIRNPIYRGAVKFAGNEFAAQHPPLVTREVWDLANAATSVTEPRPSYEFRESDVHNHLLKGLAWCGGCGRALVPNDSGKKTKSGVKYRYYTCSLVMREPLATPCTVGRLSADALEAAVVSLLGELGQHPTIVTRMIAASQEAKRGDRGALRAELDELKAALANVDGKLRNCADAIVKGGVEALGEALTRRAEELRIERQGLLTQQERRRQELALCDATVLEEKRIAEGLRNLGKTLSNLPPAEQKELVRLFVERVDVRRPVGKLPKATTAVVAPRILEIGVKLHLPELVRSVAEAKAGTQTTSHIAARGLRFEAQVDFSNAKFGEISLVAPFQRAVRVEARVRTVPVSKPPIVHPIVRAMEWQQLLAEGVVPHRLALAQKMGCTPGAVTKVLRLTKLVPEIQQHLIRLKTRAELWHFSLTRMGILAMLPSELQLPAFEKMKRSFARRHPEPTATALVPMHGTARNPRNGPRLNAG